MNIKSTLLKLFIALFLSFSATQVKAQICAASNSYGCTIMWFSAITIKNSGGTTAAYTGLNCANTGSTNKLMTNGSIMDVTPGEQLEISLENTCNYILHGGIWLDLNRDNLFASSECLSGPSGPFINIAVNTTRVAKVTVPCLSVKAGKSILRIRCGYYGYAFTANNGCGTMGNYGNILDFEVNINAVNPPIADFTVPSGPNYVKVPIVFNSSNTNTAYQQKWKFNGGTAVVGTGSKGKGSWATNGNYTVQLNQSYCGFQDSIIKAVTIVKPTVTPVADFIANTNQVEIYENVQLLDLSTNGGYIWQWELTSPTGIVYTSAQQNPIWTLDELGKWSVCLTTQNDVGLSAQVCKNKYIECVPPSDFYLGPQKLAVNQGGTLYDNGGPGLNYGNNRKVTIDYFKILPCGAKEIRFRFLSLKLADAGDKLSIYDGGDESGKMLSPIGGINGQNQATYRNMLFKATSGSMYITFESNSSGNDSGFIAVWDSELLPPKKPISNFTTPYNPAANGMKVPFYSKVTEAQGNLDYEWLVDGYPGVGFLPNLNYTFTTDGVYEVCLAANTCNGADTFCKTITIETPNKAGILDFTADNLRPKVGEVVNFTTNTNYASTFEWSIFPTTYSFVAGTNSASQNPSVVFNTGGAYTVTLRAWNSVGGLSLTEKKIIKNKYIIAVKYCVPAVDLLSSDVGINRVSIYKDGNNLMENESTSGDETYTDYSDNSITKLTFGTSYELEIFRRTNSNAANFKAWIDFNRDGEFDNTTELISSSGSTGNYSYTTTFTTPILANSFEGPTKMRVAASYGSFANSPCGVNIVGEFEDYGILLLNDGQVPVITLVGNDTLKIEKNSVAACYKEVAKTTFTAMDPTEGDLSANVQIKNDLDCQVPGTYYFDLTLVDASGNQAVPQRRVVIVVLDKTAPVLTMNGLASMTVEQCDNFTDPGAIAIDKVDGDVTTSIKTSGSVNTSVVGIYILTYTVMDAQGNSNSLTRTVEVKDTKHPGIYLKGNRITDGMIVKIQIGGLFLDEVYAEDHCNGALPINKMAGFNGVVNSLNRATYGVTYYAFDPSGNKADEDGFVVNYRVDDYIAPEIMLNTGDTVTHSVNSPYSSQNVSVTDNYYSSDKVSVDRSGSVNAFKLGVYPETFTATDPSGNVAVKTRYVKVIDREAPSIITTTVSVCVGTNFWAMSEVVISDNYYSNEQLLPLVEIISHNVNVWKAGIYFINYQVTDPSGNKSQVVLRPVLVAYPPNCENANFVSNKSIELKDMLKLFPNPSQGELNVQLSLNNEEPVSVKVMNHTGAKVANFTIGAGSTSYRMDLNHLSNGVYMLRFSNNGQVFTQKVILNK